MTIFSKRQVYHSLSLLFFIILVTACSSTRLIYSFTDKFIKDEINYFLYLDEEEKLLMNQQVSKMINGHRTSMMPSYVAKRLRRSTDVDIPTSGAGALCLELRLLTGHRVLWPSCKVECPS